MLTVNVRAWLEQLGKMELTLRVSQDAIDFSKFLHFENVPYFWLLPADGQHCLSP